MSEEGDRLDVVIKQVFERMKKLGPRPRSCPDDQLLAAYHEGSLTQREAEGIEEHLSLCDRCTENLIVLSETVSSYEPAKESLTTEEMVKRAKNLVKPMPDAPSLWERAFSWLSSVRPVPVMAAACAALVLVVLGLYNLYLPHEPGGKGSTPLGLRLIARIPDGMVTRGKIPTYKEVEIRNGGVLQSGDMFRIRFELQKDAYVYLLALNSQGDLTKLFPGRDIGTPFRAKPHEYYTVPEGAEWFRLDDKVGMERLYLISSPEIIENMDQKVDQLKQSGIDEINKIFPGIKIQSFSFKHK